jgi:hypothetical protein
MTSVSAFAEIPEPAVVVARMIEAAGGAEFREIGVLKLEVTEESTRNDGSSTETSYTVFVDTADLTHLRKEDAAIVIGRYGVNGWAMVDGKLDDRKQTPRMAKVTLNQAVFSLLLPFSLEMEGVWVESVEESSWEGKEAWKLTLPFVKGFFVSPVLTTKWSIYVSKDDHSILAVSFLPPVEYQKVQHVGMRYRYLKHDEVDGARIPSQILAIGTNLSGIETGSFRVTKITPTVHGPSDPSLFKTPLISEAESEN